MLCWKIKYDDDDDEMNWGNSHNERHNASDVHTGSLEKLMAAELHAGKVDPPVGSGHKIYVHN